MVDWIGKTLICKICGMVVRITKVNDPKWGSGPSLVCCGTEMTVKTILDENAES